MDRIMYLPPAGHWNLARELTVAQVKLKDQSSILGFLWSFLNPLLLLWIIYVMFSRRFAGQTENYTLYVLVGLVHYTHFANATTAALPVFSNMRQLATQAIFPKSLLIISVVLSRTLEFVIAIVITIGIGLATGVHLTWALLGLPFIIFLQMLFTLWVSLLLSMLYVFARDIYHIYQVILRLFFFMCPIFFTVNFVDSMRTARLVLLINPLTHLMAYSRDIVLKGQLPPISSLILWLVIHTAMVLVILRIFIKLEPQLVERA
jgi:ABC-type polysaccharide/polyol phosphate export permease